MTTAEHAQCMFCLFASCKRHMPHSKRDACVAIVLDFCCPKVEIQSYFRVCSLPNFANSGKQLQQHRAIDVGGHLSNLHVVPWKQDIRMLRVSLAALTFRSRTFCPINANRTVAYVQAIEIVDGAGSRLFAGKPDVSIPIRGTTQVVVVHVDVAKTSSSQGPATVQGSHDVTELGDHLTQSSSRYVSGYELHVNLVTCKSIDDCNVCTLFVLS